MTPIYRQVNATQSGFQSRTSTRPHQAPPHTQHQRHDEPPPNMPQMCPSLLQKIQLFPGKEPYLSEPLPATQQKSPIMPQKSPIMPRKSPIMPQKSLIFPGEERFLSEPLQCHRHELRSKKALRSFMLLTSRQIHITES